MYFSAEQQEQGILCAAFRQHAQTKRLFRNVMRGSIIITVILFGTLQLLFATPSRGQDITVEKVRVGLSGEPLIKAFREIEEQTSLRFFYRKSELNSFTKMNLSAARRTIEVTLHELLRNTGMSFRQVDQSILVEKSFIPSSSDVRITGRVVGADNDLPIKYASIELLRTSDLKLIEQTTADSTGNFTIQTKDNSPHTIRISMIGYKIYRAVIRNAQDVDLQIIPLQPDPTILEAVTVAARSPLVRQEVDRLVYNAQSDPDKNAGSVLDMLAKVPLISVDAEGNIRLKGSTNFKVLIDGKSSSLVVKDPKEIFRSMPANSIASIEVITIPPAKYDMEGIAGILNVITLKKTIDGYNGNFTLHYKDPNGPRGSANFTLKSGKFGMSVLGAYNVYNLPNTSFSNLRETAGIENSKLLQEGKSQNNTGEGILFTQYSYEADSLNLLSAIVNYSRAHGHKQSVFLTSQTGASSFSYQLDNDGKAKQQGYDLGLDYQRGFKKNKSELLSFSYRFSNLDYHQFTTLNVSKPVNTSIHDYTQENTTGVSEHTLQLDYTLPVKKAMMEAGVKSIIRNNISNYDETLFNSSDNFDYQQNIFGVYNSWQVTLRSWTMKGGARMEFTTLHANFSKGESVAIPDYNRIVPSLAVQRKLSKNASMNFGYTQRISRPGIQQLNPYIDRQNPGFISYGNVLLKPELSHNLSLNYSYYGSGSFNTGLSYSFSNNSIQYINLLDGDGVVNNTFQNIGKQATVSFFASANYALGSRLSLNANGEVRRIHLKGIVGGNEYTKNAFAGSSIINFSYKFDHDWRAGLLLQYYSPNVTLQSVSSAYYYSFVSAAKTLLRKKLTISASISNPYQRYMNYQLRYRDPAFSLLTQNEIVYRRFNIILNYSFGKLREAAVKKSKKGVKNDDISNASAPVAPGN